jgi:hypothetical protein
MVPADVGVTTTDTTPGEDSFTEPIVIEEVPALSKSEDDREFASISSSNVSVKVTGRPWGEAAPDVLSVIDSNCGEVPSTVMEVSSSTGTTRLLPAKSLITPAMRSTRVPELDAVTGTLKMPGDVSVIVPI